MVEFYFSNDYNKSVIYLYIKIIKVELSKKSQATECVVVVLGDLTALERSFEHHCVRLFVFVDRQLQCSLLSSSQFTGLSKSR